MTEHGLYYALSTIAQCAAALAALIGFLGMWRLDRFKDEENQVKQTLKDPMIQTGGSSVDIARLTRARVLERAQQSEHPDIKRTFARLNELPGEQQQLMDTLVDFLIGTLVVLVVAIVVLVFADALYTCVWTMRVVSILAGLWLGGAPVYVIVQAAGGPQAMRQHWARRAAQRRRR